MSRIQLYDKLSDQAEFTGIDDGVRTKTVNVVLKEDKKSGYFGKADGGAGTNKLHEGQLMINHFIGPLKLAAFGTWGNTGKTGLNFGDSQRYTSGSISFSADGTASIHVGGQMPVTWSLLMEDTVGGAFRRCFQEALGHDLKVLGRLQIIWAIRLIVATEV